MRSRILLSFLPLSNKIISSIDCCDNYRKPMTSTIKYYYNCNHLLMISDRIGSLSIIIIAAL